jgi:AcrR family transcriptional regulator
MASERTRDAARSREAILAAGERLFAARGFDGTSIGEVATAAGLSRGAPNYFFGSKSELYVAVLERVFADREEATRRAFEPLVAWAAEDGPGGSLEAALAEAVDGYLEFLVARPTFLRLLQREELAGGTRLRATPRDSRAIEEAFAALRRVSEARGLAGFEVADAVLVFVSLTFSPLTQRATFMAALGRDLDDPEVRRRHARLVVDQLLRLLGSP